LFKVWWMAVKGSQSEDETLSVIKTSQKVHRSVSVKRKETKANATQDISSDKRDKLLATIASSFERCFVWTKKKRRSRNGKEEKRPRKKRNQRQHLEHRDSCYKLSPSAHGLFLSFYVSVRRNTSTLFLKERRKLSVFRLFFSYLYRTYFSLSSFRSLLSLS